MSEPRGDGDIHLDERFFGALHRGLVLALATTAFVLVWWGDFSTTLWRPMAYAVAFLGGLALSRAAHVALLDLFSQMQYRERLLVFVVHLAVFFVPILVKYGDWMDGLATVAVLMSFQAVREVHYNRLYAILGLLVFCRALWLPLPPTGFVALWMFLLLSCIRVEYVRFRLERYSSGLGLRPRAFLGESVLSVVVPWGLATILYSVLAVAMEGHTRELNLEARGTVTSTELGPVSVTSVLVDAIVIVASIIGTLLMLQWLEKKIRRRRRGETPGEEEFGHASEERRDRAPEEPAPREQEEEGTPRARLLARFRGFMGEMKRVGLPREEGETAPEYVGRLGRRAMGLPPWSDAVARFERACYSELEVTAGDADAVAALLDRIEPILKEQGSVDSPPTGDG